MKFSLQKIDSFLAPVTLHVRVWIEIFSPAATCANAGVTLHVRVWIEM